MIAVTVTFLLLLTPPVLYAKPASGAVARISAYDSLFYLNSVPRSIILTDIASDWRGFAIAAGLSFFVLTICVLVFHMTATRVAEWV